MALGRSLALDAGELSALALARFYPSALFLTDDTAARLAATHMQFKVHGSLGILLRAVRVGQRSAEEMKVVLGSLKQRSTLHIRQDLLDWAVKQLEQYKRYSNGSSSPKTLPLEALTEPDVKLSPHPALVTQPSNTLIYQ